MAGLRNEFVGVGWAFPVRAAPDGGIEMAGGVDKIEQAIRLILGTAPGERPMRPEFGCGIHEHVFDPVNATTAGAIEHEVRSALLRWEPRINVTDVDVLTDPEEPSTLYVHIEYVVNADNSPRNLVFPFYTIPVEA